MPVTQRSEIAKLVLVAISHGYLLRVPHDQSGVTLVPDPRFMPNDSVIAVDGDASAEVLNSKLLGPLTPDGTGSKIGWKTIGVDGSRADFYKFIQ